VHSRHFINAESRECTLHASFDFVIGEIGKAEALAIQLSKNGCVTGMRGLESQRDKRCPVVGCVCADIISVIPDFHFFTHRSNLSPSSGFLSLM